MKSHYFRIARILVRPLGYLILALGLMSLLGYALEIEPLFRPIKGGPATNPLTAVVTLLLGAALSIKGLRQTAISKPLFLLAAVASTLRLTDGTLGTHFAPIITPFQKTVEAQLALGEINAMGLNTALMLLLASLSLLLNGQRKPIPSQVLAFLSLALPMVSLTGYAYGLDKFYGKMSLMTVSLGIMLATAALCSSVHRGVLRAILGPYIGGRIARMQVLFGYLVPFFFGFLLVKIASLGSGENLFGVFVVSTSWFIVGLVAVSAVIQERVDWRRRVAERALNFAASSDLLTKLPNRRKFFDVGQREWLRVKRSSGTLSILMIDVDHFKRINDTGGHATGDFVLVAVAKELARSVRSVDFPARIGGEEFTVLLPDTGLDGAMIVAEQIRQKIANLTFDPWPENLGAVTISIGCASSNCSQSLEEIMMAADGALYDAKAQGRNRTVAAREHQAA